MEILYPEKLTEADLGNWPAHTELKCPCGHERREHISYAFRCHCGCPSYQGAIPTDRDYMRDDWAPSPGPASMAQQSEQVPVQMTEEEAMAYFGGGL